MPDAADDTAPIWSPDDYARFARHALPAVRTWALSRLAHLYPADARLPAALADALFDPSISVQSAALRTLDAIAREPPLRAPDAAAYAPALAALGRYAARREQPARLRAEARRVHDALATPAGASAPLPAGDALRAQLATVDEAADERLETLSRALEADPAVLRGWAPAVLRGELDTAASRLAWTALGAQNTRWATALILEALPRALDAGEFTEPWDALEQLGDPAALPAVVREWRAGERRIARLGVLLAALTPEAAALPDALRREGEAAVALALENDVMVLRADDPREALTRAAAERPLLLPLRCNQCGRVYWYDVHGVYMHPDPDACAREGWDGVTLQRVLVCKRCGAEDDYALTAWAQLELTGELLRISTQGGRLRATPRVTFGVPGLWDGTVARRPSQGLRHLRALAERTPSAEAWRRVGNFAERIGRPDEAEAAWRAAIALDDNDVAAGRPLTPLPPGEVDAAHAYADYLLAQGRRDEAWPYLARAFARLPSQLGADTDPRDRVHDLLASLRNAARAEGASAVLPVRLALAWRERDRAASSPETHGALDPRRFAQWDALEAFLAGTTLVRAELVTGAGAEVTPEETQAVIAALAHASSTVGVREARVGRNDPCPCGSGRKFKKCCGK